MLPFVSAPKGIKFLLAECKRVLATACKIPKKIRDNYFAFGILELHATLIMFPIVIGHDDLKLARSENFLKYTEAKTTGFSSVANESVH